MRYAAIDSLRAGYPVSVLCAVLEVSTSGYHEWRGRPASARKLANDRLVSEIRVLHAESFGSYGSPRIHAAFKRQGRPIGRERIRRLMREHHVVGRHRKKRCRTTDSNHALPIAPNLLQQNFACEAPNAVWLADISYLATDEGFLYFAAMKDLCTKKIVGWSMSKTIDAQLVVDALAMAIDRQRPSAGLIVHSDRGSQYASADFRGALAEHHFLQSMSRRGNCYDNAPMESFFSSLKGEYLEHQRFATHAAARTAVFTYVETFYNRVRLHSSIGYRPPNEFEAMLRPAA
jgi:transposase InsO family protein